MKVVEAEMNKTSKDKREKIEEIWNNNNKKTLFFHSSLITLN